MFQATLAVPTLPAIPRTLVVTAARLRGPIAAVLALVLEVHSAVAGSGTCGTFSDATEYDVPAIAVATADLDSDGDLDIATAGGGDSVSILLNAGDGTWDPGGTYGAGWAPRSLASGDFDGDGDVDLAVATDLGGPDDAHLYVLLNTGDGSFVAAGAYVVTGYDPDGWYSVVAGDLDGDGDLDLAVAFHQFPAAFVLILLNTGDGAFVEGDVTELGLQAGGESLTSIAAGDLDGDGDLDIAVTDDDAYVYVLANGGDGTFGVGDYHLGQAAISPNSVVIADLNGDGDLDLATANFVSVSVLLNVGNGTFAAAVVRELSGVGHAIAAGDLDQDGDIDLALRFLDHVAVLMNDGDATFADDVLYAADSYAHTLAAGDLDGDGDLDLATANGHVQILLNACPSSCREDLDGSSAVDVDDLIAVITSWGLCPGCPADLDGNGVVNVDDLVPVILTWGPCH